MALGNEVIGNLLKTFDLWIRGPFVEMNTALEELYFAREDRASTLGTGEKIKGELHDEGRSHIAALLRAGITGLDVEGCHDLLGSIGLYMAACERHSITDCTRQQTSPLIEASALAIKLGSGLGVVPRFTTSSMSTHNRALQGVHKSFTSLADEHLFTDYNNLGIFAHKRAADALMYTLPLDVSHPVTLDLLHVARNALLDVERINNALMERLDPLRFFYCVRPYFKPHRVGSQIYRGANAGDFAGINIIDLLLGLCQTDDLFYSQIITEKLLFMRPEDQALLREGVRARSLMDRFLRHSQHDSKHDWYKKNLSAFLEVCDVHGRTAAQHHNHLVKHFIVDIGAKQQQATPTASGPPLAALLVTLEKLRDLRMAAPRNDIRSRYADIQRLRASLE